MTSMLDAAPAGSRTGSFAAVLGTAGAHGLLVLGASLIGLGGVVELKKALPVTEMVEVELPAPPPQPEPEVPAPTLPKAAPRAAPAPTAEPPPSAAQAGQVLDSTSDVVDFGDTIVTGSGSSYAGGVTDRSGTSQTAVRDAAARGDSGGRGTTPAPAPVDRSRAPALMGGDSWNCPFPAEADDAGIDLAVVKLSIALGADGSVQSVSIAADPGNGFGREARRCATNKRFAPGLDRDGRPVAQAFSVNVRFRR